MAEWDVAKQQQTLKFGLMDEIRVVVVVVGEARWGERRRQRRGQSGVFPGASRALPRGHRPVSLKGLLEHFRAAAFLLLFHPQVDHASVLVFRERQRLVSPVARRVFTGVSPMRSTGGSGLVRFAAALGIERTTTTTTATSARIRSLSTGMFAG